jgi:hypothetical protein
MRATFQANFFMAKENTPGSMVTVTMATGRRARKPGKVRTDGKMVQCTRGKC